MTATAPTSHDTATGTAPLPRWLSIDFDCPDPRLLSRFYSRALGLAVRYAADDFVLLGGEGDTPGLGFIRIDDYRPPTWPDPALGKQAHLELGVEDLDTAQARMIELGAVEADFQPDPLRRRVLLDPAGHPFCLTTTF